MNMPNTLVVMQLPRREDVPQHIRHTFRMDEPEYKDRFLVLREGDTIDPKWADQVLILADDVQLASAFIINIVDQLRYWMPHAPMMVLPVEEAPPPPFPGDVQQMPIQYWGQP